MKNKSLTSLLAAAFGLIQLEAASAQEQGKTEQNEAELLKIQKTDCGANKCPTTAKEEDETTPAYPKGASERIQRPTTN
ncbi:MAG: hypothetical protein K2P93_02860 [Alphaproteobacteria bacterium]|nr:hypothetical protein [Alphaproteobacteria bacterium]